MFASNNEKNTRAAFGAQELPTLERPWYDRDEPDCRLFDHLIKQIGKTRKTSYGVIGRCPSCGNMLLVSEQPGNRVDLLCHGTCTETEVAAQLDLLPPGLIAVRAAHHDEADEDVAWRMNYLLLRYARWDNNLG